MPQNLISIQLAAADLTAIDGALKTLEDRLTVLIELSPEQRRRAVKMGGKSEAFARTAVEVLSNNPNVLPVNFSLPEVRRDLVAFDAPEVGAPGKVLRTDVRFATGIGQRPDERRAGRVRAPQARGQGRRAGYGTQDAVGAV